MVEVPANPSPPQESEQEAEERAAAEEKGRLLFAKPCTFIIGVATADQLPPPGLPEIAFAGRSNVGKSSLVNALVGHKALARTSNTPGRTREVNFFDLGSALYLVDLPGYGYAQASKTEINRWNRLIMDYLRGRVGLRRVFLLIDARRGIMENDEKVMARLDDAAVSFQGVLTKSDKLKATELERTIDRCRQILERHPAAFPDILVTSARKGTGIAGLRAAVAALALDP